jgi:hypothetical protein
VWDSVGGRPNQKWTPELCRSLAGEEYFSAVSLQSQATGDTVPKEDQVDGTGTGDENAPTSTEASPAVETDATDAAAEAPTAEETTETASSAGSEASQEDCDAALNEALNEAGGDITSDNITLEEAQSAALSDAEREECAKCGGSGSSSSIAQTAAGARKIAEVQAIKDSFADCPPTLPGSETTAGGATPASSSSAAAAANPPATPAASATCTAGGGGGGGSGGPAYAPGAAYSVGADRTGEPLGDVPFVGTLGEVTTNPKMSLVDIPMDKTRQPTSSEHPYYASKVSVRSDVAGNMSEIKRIMNELGAVMTSSGATRRLSATVSPGRIATSFHYTSLAFDFTLPAMMSNPNVDEHVIEFDPEDNKQFIFWSRSDKTSGSVEKGGVTFSVEHKTLNAIVSKRGAPPGTEPVEGYWVNVTKIMRAHGMERISGTSGWYRDCSGHSEAWHFDFRKNAGLVVGQTTFGQVLETVYTADQISGTPPAASAHKTWRGSYFG